MSDKILCCILYTELLLCGWSRENCITKHPWTTF